jgi:hypothetical protein
MEGYRVKEKEEGERELEKNCIKNQLNRKPKYTNR